MTCRGGSFQEIGMCMYRYLLTYSFNAVIMNIASRNEISALLFHICIVHVTSSNVANEK